MDGVFVGSKRRDKGGKNGEQRVIAGHAGHFHEQLLEMGLKGVRRHLVLFYVAGNAFEQTQQTPQRRKGKRREERNELFQPVKGRMHRTAHTEQLFQTALHRKTLSNAHQILRFLRLLQLQARREDLHHKRTKHWMKPLQRGLSDLDHRLLLTVFTHSHNVKQLLQHAELDNGIDETGIAKPRDCDGFVRRGDKHCSQIQPRKPKIGENTRDETALFGWQTRKRKTFEQFDEN